MKPNFKKYCIFLALFAAAAALILLFVKCNEADVTIVIGFPAENAADAVDYTRSKPISDRQTVNHILFALLSGKSLAGPAAPDTPPDAVMMIQSKKENLAYQFSVWVDQTNVIYAMGTGSEAAEYRVTGSLSDEELRIFDRIKSAEN